MTDSDLDNLDNLDDPEETLTFDYIKSNFFRVIYVDGAMADLNSNDTIHLVLWNERRAIPNQETYSVSPEGFLGDEISYISKTGMIREVEADIILNRESALSLKRLLENILSDED